MRALLWSVLVAAGLSGCVTGGPYGYGGPGDDPYGGYGGSYAGGAQQVRCESNDGRTRHCPMDTSRGVQLVRQLSDSACVRDRTWGYDRGGVWVGNGCRADFASGGGYGGGDGAPGGYGQLVRCESTDGHFRSCPADTRGGMALVRQLSDTACIHGQTWGWDARGVWVNRGCRAEFRTGGGADGGGYGGYPGGAPRTVRCESNDGRPHRCDTPVRRAALQRQISNTRCIQGQTWGWDPRGLWVTAGCRGDFSVW
ncbi:MAG: DUF3011 domain-containing protein [Lysobacteraceae bacterium]